MPSNVSYIYEYEEDQRIRNVGFVKMQMQGSDCTISIHIKSASIRPQSIWKLYAFRSDGSFCTLYPLADLPGNERALHAGLKITPELLPKGTLLDSMEGFWIGGNGRRIFAAAWKPTFVDSSRFRIWQEKEENATPDTAETPQAEDVPQAEDPPQTETAPQTEHTDAAGSLPKMPEAPAPPDTGETGAVVPSPKEEDTPPDTADTAETEDTPVSDQEQSAGSPGLSCRKIRRKDMTILPRKEWYLANNSFLLHGYRNYHHLLLVEENDRWFLGVPGIYDPREAHAAELFGFPRFSDEYAASLELDDSERNPNGLFGHYFRRIRK